MAATLAAVLGARVASATPVGSATSPSVTRLAKPAPKASEDDQYDDPEIDDALPSRAHFAIRTGLVTSLYSWHEDRVFTVGPHLSLGSERSNGAYYFDIMMAHGRTEGTLGAWRFKLGADLEWPAGLFRVGFAPRAGIFVVDRVTVQRSLVNVTIGTGLVTSIDLFRTDGLALAFAVQPSIDLLGSDEGKSGLFGISFGLDLRFRSSKGPIPRLAPPTPKKPVTTTP